MDIKNTNTSYGSIAKLFHWGMFLIIAGILILGLYMGDLPKDTPEQMSYKYSLYDYHKSFGVLILLLVIARLGWRMKNPVPEMPDSMSKIEGLSAHAMHILLYVIMFAQPLSGWMMSNSAGIPVKFFGLEMPTLIDKDKAMSDFFHEAHEVVATLLMVAIAIHVAAALFHHFIRKDDVMERMSPHPKKTN